MKTKPSRSLELRPQKKKWVLPAFLGGLLVLSTFAIIFSGPGQSSTSSYKYHDIYFRLTPQGWESTVQGQPLVLRYGPKELESLYPDFPYAASLFLLSLQKLYLSTLPGEPIQEALRDFYLQSAVLPPVTLACVVDVSGCEELPVKGCADATETIGVVIFRVGDEDALTVDRTCVTLVANTTTSLTQMTDTLLYFLYGVFP